MGRRTPALGPLAAQIKGLKDNKGVQQETAFESLDLSGGRVTDADCEGIARFIEAAAGQLRRLSLGNNKLTEAGVSQLADPLHMAVNLQELWLGDNPLGDGGVKVVAAPCLGRLPAYGTNHKANEPRTHESSPNASPIGSTHAERGGDCASMVPGIHGCANPP